MVFTSFFMLASFCATASGMYASEGLSPAGSLTIPTTLKLVVVPLLLPMAIVDPTDSLFCVA